MRIVDLRQHSPEWHAWRNAGVTASEVPVLLGSPYKTPWRLWAEKRGLVFPEDLSGNPHVQRGIRQETIARRRFEERHDVLLLPVCAESTDEPIIRASFDGLTDDGRPVELKAPSEANFRDAQGKGKESELYRRYYGQVQAQIFVAESDGGFLSLNFGEQALDLPVPRDDGYIAQLVAAARGFWEHIKTGKEPPLDPERDMYVPRGEELEFWLVLAAEYRQLDKELAPYVTEVNAIEKKMADLQKKFVGMMGNFTVAESSGIRISRYLQKGSVDYKAALNKMCPKTQEDDFEQFRKKPSERVRVTVREEDDQRTEVPFEPEVVKQSAGLDAWF